MSQVEMRKGGGVRQQLEGGRVNYEKGIGSIMRRV